MKSPEINIRITKKTPFTAIKLHIYNTVKQKDGSISFEINKEIYDKIKEKITIPTKYSVVQGFFQLPLMKVFEIQEYLLNSVLSDEDAVYYIISIFNSNFTNYLQKIKRTILRRKLNVFQWFIAIEAVTRFFDIFTKQLNKLQVPQNQKEIAANKVVEKMINLTIAESAFFFLQKKFNLQNYRQCENFTVQEFLMAKRDAFVQDIFEREIIKQDTIKRK